MRSRISLLALVISVAHAWAIWVPAVPPKSSPDYQSFQNEGVWSAPGYSASDSMFKWVDIPDVGITILPPVARPAPALTASSTGQVEQKIDNTTLENKATEEKQAAQREATIPRFNDVSADVEYGIISLKPKYGNTFKGFGISAKARYERQLNENSGYGARIDNEYTKYEKVYANEIPGSDFLLIGAFFRRYLGRAIETGGQLNGSFFFRTIQSFSGGKMKDSAVKTDWAVNPMVYGIYNYELHMGIPFCGPLSGYGGAFAGYTYNSFSFAQNQISYAGIGSIGTTFGQNVAAQADVALSHEFLVMGIQVPVYLSRLFSITPGFKYPLVFKATNLHVLRITIGASTRF